MKGEQIDTTDETDNTCVESEVARMRAHLLAEGKSDATIGKYLRDTGYFLRFAEEMTGSVSGCNDWDVIQRYREHLASKYELSSCNSMIAGANCYLRLSGNSDLKIRSFKVQREVFRSDGLELTKEEYHRLLSAAKAEGNERLYLIIQTLGSTGMRISELPFVTTEALEHRKARVSLKGKTRTVILPATLCCRLERYAKAAGITRGSVFITRTGNPVDRSNVLHEMKRLGVKAGVDEDKIYPHNLRHLFAVTYYRSERDLLHLADILGHSNVNTTRIYTAEGERSIAAAIENLGLL